MQTLTLKSVQVKSATVAEIKRLHSEILNAARTSLDKAIRIGELLREEKSRLAHGQWLPWLEANAPFTDRTATNYMRLFNERDRIKSESVSDLSSAYRLLAPPRERDVSELEKRCDEQVLAVRAALLEIRDRKLYRENHNTFEDYCREQWGWRAEQTYIDVKLADSLLLRIELAENIQ